MTPPAMTPEQVLAAIIAVAAPGGPWGNEEQIARRRQDLLAGDPVIAANQLLTAVALGSSLPESVPVTWDDLNVEIADLLADLAADERVRGLLVQSLDDAPIRVVVLDALALRADPGAAPALTRLAAEQRERPFLPEDELIRLASALGSVGGPEARAEVLRLSARSWTPAVDRELMIARQAIEGWETAE